jgi:hypothetical protein
MADFIELTDAETAFKKPIRQALMRKIKDDFTNLNARLKEVEAGTRIFDHFANGVAGARSFPLWSVNDAGSPIDYMNDVTAARKGLNWILLGRTDGASGANPVISNDVKPHYSIARMNSASTWGSLVGTGRWNLAFSTIGFQFDNVVKPIIFRGHFRMSDTNRGIFIGLYGTQTFNHLDPSKDGVYIQRVDATDWRFVSEFSGSRTNGATFTKPGNNPWFDVEVEFTDTPVNKVLTRIAKDGQPLAQIDDLQADLPMTVPLFHIFGVDHQVVASNVWLDADHAEYRAGDYTEAS